MTEITVDRWITDKATHLLGQMCTMVGDTALQAADQLRQQIPSSLQDSTFRAVQTSAGQLELFADISGESIAAASAAQIATNNAEKIAASIVKAQELSNKVEQLTGVNQEKKERLYKDLEKVCHATEVINKDRLLEISKTVPQVEEFRKFTDNFTRLEKLQQNEILYLNLCDWLEPQATRINAQVKNMGLKITEIKDGITCFTNIYEFDIFHSLLGEMRPGSVKSATSGGHWFLSELKASTFEVTNIEAFGSGFFDMSVKHTRGNSANYIAKSYFPVGSTIEECVDMVIDAIKDGQSIINITEAQHINQSLFQAKDKLNQVFGIRVTGTQAKFFPCKI